MMNQRERMLAGLPYKAWLDGLDKERLACKKKIYEYNHLPPDDWDRLPSLLKHLLGQTGARVWIEPPFHCDYGWNIEVGEDFYANYNLTVLDVGKVTVGRGVLFGPNVSIYAAGHPVHPVSRASGYEYGSPVTIGDYVWVGGSVVILAGVHIGENTVIAAGSVVTKDIPANCVAAGNPCRPLRAITEQDRDFYFQRRRFDVTDY